MYNDRVYNIISDNDNSDYTVYSHITRGNLYSAIWTRQMRENYRTSVIITIIILYDYNIKRSNINRTIFKKTTIIIIIKYINNTPHPI